MCVRIRGRTVREVLLGRGTEATAGAPSEGGPQERCLGRNGQEVLGLESKLCPKGPTEVFGEKMVTSRVGQG